MGEITGLGNAGALLRAGDTTATGGPPTPVKAPPPPPPPKTIGDGVTTTGAQTAPMAVTGGVPALQEPTGPISTPAPGSPEADLLKAMDKQPGLPPQWTDAYLHLPPDEQKQMAKLFQALPPQDRASFLVQPPAIRQSMAQMYGRMTPEQQKTFVHLPTNQQKAMAGVFAKMGEESRTTFLAMPAADQQALAEMHEDGTPAVKAMIAGMSPQEMRAASTLYGGMNASNRASFQAAPVADQKRLIAFIAQVPDNRRSGMVKAPIGDMAQAAIFAEGLQGPAKATFLARPAAEQIAIGKTYRSMASPAAQAAFLALKPEQQTQFTRLWADCDRVNFGSSGPTPENPGMGVGSRQMQGHLENLLASGKLTQVGSDGKTTMDHLERLQTVPLSLPPGANESHHRQTVYGALLQELDEPQSISQGDNNTCGVTCLQRDFCRSKPADYAGFVVGLASTEGKGRLPDGTMVKRAPDALLYGTRKAKGKEVVDSRTETERLVQTSLANHVSPTHYSNVKDGNTLGPIAIPGTLSGGMAAVHNAIHGTKTKPMVSDSSAVAMQVAGSHKGVTKPTLFVNLQQTVLDQKQAGQKPHVPACINWNESGTSGVLGTDLHWVEVTNVEKGRVYYENPQGNSFDDFHGQMDENMKPKYPLSKEPDPANGLHYIEVPAKGGDPARRIYTDGSESVPQAWFEKSIEMVVVDDPAKQK